MKCRSGPISAFSSFNYELLLGGGKRRLVLFVLVLVLGILASAVPSGASTVGCAGASGGPFDFTSLTAALNAPGALMNNTITLSGICTESAVIFGAQNLNIIGTPGAALMDPGGSAIGAVLEIDNSQGMNVRTLRIQLSARTAATGIPGVAVNSSTVHLFQCQIEGAAGSDGIDISGPNADVRIHGGIIENNNDGQGNGEGVFVQGPGAILFLLSDEAGNCPLIQGSGDSGIWATATGAHVAIPPIRGCATIQNNFTGIQLNLGATVGIGVSQTTPGAVQLLNNTVGVLAYTGAHFGISGPALIQGNTQNGLRLRTNGGGAIGPAPDGPSGPTIQQNGTSTVFVCCTLPAAISIVGNSHLEFDGGLVTNNPAPGVFIDDDSSVRFIGPLTITRNTIGLEVADVSSAVLFFAPSISGNATMDMVCGPDSTAHGDLSAVGKINCPQFRPQLNAVTPPPRNRKVIP